MLDKDDDYDVEISPLGCVYKEGDKQVEVEIYNNGQGKWILEVVDVDGNSCVSDELYDTDADALAEFKAEVKASGIDIFIGLDH